MTPLIAMARLTIPHHRSPDGCSPLSGHRLSAEERARGRAERWRRYRERRSEIEQEARERAVAALVESAEPAAEVLVGQLDSENERVALMAARDILDRLLGKAMERHEHSRPDGGEIVLRGDISPERLREEARKLMEGK